MQLSLVVTLLVGISVAAGEAPAQMAPVSKRQRIATIGEFFEAMGSEQRPTIAKFEHLFGPHSEEELILQLRYLGDRSPMDVPADPAMVRRVNERLVHPTRHASLFLCFLRREMPELRSGRWHVTNVIRREKAGEEIYTVSVGGLKVSFGFPIGDDYIGSLVDAKDTIVSAGRFLPLCRLNACCQ
jgi:hypothetical protein